MAPAPSPPVSTAPRVGAIVATLTSSVILIGMCGCFLIGVLGLIRPEVLTGGPPSGTTGIKPVILSPEEQALMYTLYGLALVSFLASIVLLFLAVRGLRRLL
jgi:hypothetical protein